MSTTTAAIMCSVAGGCLELAGLVTVVLGIKADQRQAEQMFEPRMPPPPKKRRRSPRTSALQLRHADHAILRSSRAMKDRQYESEAALVNAHNQLVDDVDQAFDQFSSKLRAEMIEHDSDLREKIRYVLGESVGLRRVGVLLLAAGILLAMAGSVLGAAS